MSPSGAPSGFEAVQALVNASGDFKGVADKDWAAAAGLIVKKLLISAGQTTDSLNALRATAGEDIFEAQLKSLTPYQAKLLAKRLDKSVPDLEVSTAGAAIAHVRTLLTPAADPPTEEPETEIEAAPETTTDAETETVTDDPPPSPPSAPNPYFGRKSFRTG
ncbi:MAG: hypothetical protein RLO80_12405 [Hyphomonas sp.]